MSIIERRRISRSIVVVFRSAKERTIDTFAQRKPTLVFRTMLKDIGRGSWRQHVPGRVRTRLGLAGCSASIGTKFLVGEQIVGYEP